MIVSNKGDIKLIYCILIIIICLAIVALVSIPISKWNLDDAYWYSYSHKCYEVSKEVHQIIHEAKEKAWKEYQFSIDGFAEKQPTIQVCGDSHALYQAELDKIQKEKEEYSEQEKERKKKNAQYIRWGKEYMCKYEPDFPNNKYLRYLLNSEDLHQRIVNHEENIQKDMFESSYCNYYSKVNNLIRDIAQRQAEIYDNFGLDENAQGKVELKHKWNDLPKIIIPKKEEVHRNSAMDWFPYPDMDRAYFED